MCHIYRVTQQARGPTVLVNIKSFQKISNEHPNITVLASPSPLSFPVR